MKELGRSFQSLRGGEKVCESELFVRLFRRADNKKRFKRRERVQERERVQREFKRREREREDDQT